MGLVGIKGMVGENNIRIVGRHADVDGCHHVRGKGNVLGGKIQNLNILNSQHVQSIESLFYCKFIRTLQLSFLVGVTGLTHNQHFYRMTTFNCLCQSTAAGNFDIIQMCANR